ncbi:MAG: isocitrate lyase/PEP mutase family protein, partial [Burkholderiaceae bacterium]
MSAPAQTTAVMPAARGTLRRTLASGRFVVAPGVFEMFSAKLADRMGFDALYMTGYGISGSHLGQPDAGLAGFTDMAGRARTIAHGITSPLIADADTGFGGLLNVRHTVRGYEEAGVQAIQIEDQETPKKCGHTPNRRVVPFADAVRRVEVAVDARRSADMLIVARTDTRTGLGLDEA